jgi:hypothetical protein
MSMMGDRKYFHDEVLFVDEWMLYRDGNKDGGHELSFVCLLGRISMGLEHLGAWFGT